MADFCYTSWHRIYDQVRVIKSHDGMKRIISCVECLRPVSLYTGLRCVHCYKPPPQITRQKCNLQRFWERHMMVKHKLPPIGQSGCFACDLKVYREIMAWKQPNRTRSGL